MKLILQSVKTKKFFVAVGETGFRQVVDRNKATRFEDLLEVNKFRSTRGIAFPTVVLYGYKIPKLTKLEHFVRMNSHRSDTSLASELNRTEGVVTRAFSSADAKVREQAAIFEEDRKAYMAAGHYELAVLGGKA